jgi:hypothetical protein
LNWNGEGDEDCTGEGVWNGFGGAGEPKLNAIAARGGGVLSGDGGGAVGVPGTGARGTSWALAGPGARGARRAAKP